jgi:hypothetical protein
VRRGISVVDFSVRPQEIAQPLAEGKLELWPYQRRGVRQRTAPGKQRIAMLAAVSTANCKVVEPATSSPHSSVTTNSCRRASAASVVA